MKCRGVGAMLLKVCATLEAIIKILKRPLFIHHDVFSQNLFPNEYSEKHCFKILIIVLIHNTILVGTTIMKPFQRKGKTLIIRVKS